MGASWFRGIIKRSNLFVIGLSLGMLLSGQLAQAEENKAVAEKKVEIYLLIGQSNMSGRATITEEYNKPLDGTLLFNDKAKWIPAVPPLNLYSTVRKDAGMQKINPGVGFAIAMHKAEPDATIGLVVNALGGSKIEQWDPKKGKLYAEAIKRVKEAAKSGVIKGVLWHQGEANANDADYMKKISALIAGLRQDLGIADLPFVAGQINSSKQEYLFNKLILTLPENVKYTAVVTSEGLVATDTWHFDTASQIELGRRYAEAMLKLQNAGEKR